jgi:hypothetical protein
MQAIEFEATTFQHTIRIPDGVSVRIVLSFDDTKIKSEGDPHKNLLASIPNVGCDEDFARDNETERQAALAHIAATQVDWQGKPIADRDAFYDASRD